ncbi:MAG TPA: hypothetical protein VNT22_04310 [Baekduia sp.]|nr:hypothetical protein [Baekduia sp.]
MKRGMVLVMLAVSTLAGCGEQSQSDSDKAKIREVIRQAAAGQNPREVCRSYTSRFLKERFTNTDRCEVAVHWAIVFDDKFQLGTTARVESLKIDDGYARARVRYTYDGLAVHGHVRLSQTQGTWKISDWERDLIRSIVKTTFRSEHDRRMLPALEHPATVRCLQRWTDLLDDREARDQLFPVGSLDPAARRREYAVLKRCVAPRKDGRSALRVFHENEIRASSEINERPIGEAECLVEHSRKITEDQLLDSFVDFSAEAAEITGAAQIECIGQSS